ncbi:hypothetical protein Vafri_15312, partial [Volvox africanus]
MLIRHSHAHSLAPHTMAMPGLKQRSAVLMADAWQGLPKWRTTMTVLLFILITSTWSVCTAAQTAGAVRDGEYAMNGNAVANAGGGGSSGANVMGSSGSSSRNINDGTEGTDSEAGPGSARSLVDVIAARLSFQYGRCTRGTSNNPYRLVITSNVSEGVGASKVCFRLAVSRDCSDLDPTQRPGMCCRELVHHVHKIYIETDPLCKGSLLSSTMNGLPGRSWTWEAAAGPSAALKLSPANLNSTQ